MKKLFLAIALIGILGFASATNATVMLAGNAADQGAFVGLLNLGCARRKSGFYSDTCLWPDKQLCKPY